MYMNVYGCRESSIWATLKLLSISAFNLDKAKILSSGTRFNPFPKDKSYSSKLKEFADDNFELDGSGRKLSKWIENTGRKGEIAVSILFSIGLENSLPFSSNLRLSSANFLFW